MQEVTKHEKDIARIVNAYRKIPLNTPGKMYTVHLRMADKVYEPLRARADALGLTMSQVVREISIIYLETLRGSDDA